VHLQAGREAEASAAIDEAIRSAFDEPLPVAEFGPAVEQRWTERAQLAKQRPGQPLAVRCAIACRVYANERELTPLLLRELGAGTYRVWIAAFDGSQPTVRTEVELGRGAEPIVIRYGTAQVRDDPTRTVPSNVGKRAMNAGKGLMIAGGALTSLGVALFVGGVHGGSLDAVGVGAISGLIGAPILIAGGVTYGVGKRCARRAGRAGLVTPTLLVGRGGAQLGVAFEFAM